MKIKNDIFKKILEFREKFWEFTIFTDICLFMIIALIIEIIIF